MAQVAHDADAAFPDLLVENKGRVAVTIHWRNAARRSRRRRRRSRPGWPGATTSIAPLRGRMSVELRPPVPVDKGTVDGRARRAVPSVAVFAGDDAGDLVAFDVLTRLAESGAVAHTIRIGVRSDEAPPGIFDADVLVDGPRGLAARARRPRRPRSARVRGDRARARCGACAPTTSSRRRVARSRRSSSCIDSARCSASRGLFDVERVHRERRFVELRVGTRLR